MQVLLFALNGRNFTHFIFQIPAHRRKEKKNMSRPHLSDLKQQRQAADSNAPRIFAQDVEQQPRRQQSAGPRFPAEPEAGNSSTSSGSCPDPTGWGVGGDLQMRQGNCTSASVKARHWGCQTVEGVAASCPPRGSWRHENSCQRAGSACAAETPGSCQAR